MGGRHRKLRRAWPLACLAPVAPAAEAGAWSLAEGGQQSLVTVSREIGDFGEAWRSDGLTEYGLGDGWGLNFKVESEIRIDDTFDDRSGVRIGLQKAFPVGERGSIAIQASALLGESIDGIECEDEGYEIRAAAGTSFSLWDREGFVNAEAGRRARGDCTRDVAELAMGLNFAPDWHVNLKLWSEGGGETGVAKVETSIMREFWGVGIGVGWREEISGNFEEKGWVLNGRMRF